MVVSVPYEHVHSLPLCFDEPIGPSISSHSLQSFRVEIQVLKDPVLPPDTPIDFHLIVEVTSKKRELFTKKSLEEVLIHLRDKALVILDPIQDLVNEDKIKIIRQSKKNTKRVNDLDFRNKRNGIILSRMTKNRHNNHDKPIPTVLIEDTIFIEGVNYDATRMDSPQYMYVYKFSWMNITEIYCPKCVFLCVYLNE
jgi:hypothetical protein